jgi:hypothetical protein
MEIMVAITAIVFIDRCLARYAVAELRAGLVFSRRYATAVPAVLARFVLGSRVHHFCCRTESAMESKPVVAQICAALGHGLHTRIGQPQ